MASSRVMASSSSTNSDLARHSSIYSKTASGLQNSVDASDPPKGLGSMSMEDLLRNVYGDNAPSSSASPYVGGVCDPDAGVCGVQATVVKGAGFKTTEEVWREITAGRRPDAAAGSESESKEDEGMTLEDFLAREGAVMEEDVRLPLGVISSDMAANDKFVQQPPQQQVGVGSPLLGFGNGVDLVAVGGGRGGRGRRRTMLDPVDKAALQRQKRMIKNRESAARSRERKQAYTAELESLVHKLEQENTQLHNELEQSHKEKLKQLMERVFPSTMKKSLPKRLRRTSSLEW
ncbi:hypothetical protein HPP92_000067 [Vanilla planifolia]|uniref:BZIP domain-containing protein n=1 Tax=Vanilla planifolia TaxID=51239 RepID=A0A835RVG8_VANPL|nr:hypothetical protein HPP92_000067 [Vanilla planifolia]